MRCFLFLSVFTGSIHLLEVLLLIYRVLIMTISILFHLLCLRWSRRVLSTDRGSGRRAATVFASALRCGPPRAGRRIYPHRRSLAFPVSASQARRSIHAGYFAQVLADLHSHPDRGQC